jgi:hypothetical protein
MRCYEQTSPARWTREPFRLDRVGSRRSPALGYGLVAAPSELRNHYLARLLLHTSEYWPLGANSSSTCLDALLLGAKIYARMDGIGAYDDAAARVRFARRDTLEATQSIIEFGARDTFYLSDQEVLTRHFHRAVHVDGADHRA